MTMQLTLTRGYRPPDRGYVLPPATPAPTTNRMGCHLPNYEPTPAEIAAQCELLQAGWSRAEERQRRMIHNPKARVPTVRL